MSPLSSEPATPADDWVPAGETSEAWTAGTILAQTRALASELDPPRAQTYRAMPLSRWLQVINLGADLLTTHAVYRLHHAPGRGRRQHAAEMHAVLDETNSANLVAALTLMLVLGRILDRSPRGA